MDKEARKALAYAVLLIAAGLFGLMMAACGEIVAVDPPAVAITVAGGSNVLDLDVFDPARELGAAL